MWSKNYETPAPQNAYIQPFYSTLSGSVQKRRNSNSAGLHSTKN
jgi:hypothetical protein